MGYLIISLLALPAILLSFLNNPYHSDTYGADAQLSDPSGRLMLYPYRLQPYTSIGGKRSMLNFHLPCESRIEWEDRTSSYWITGKNIEIRRGGTISVPDGKTELRDQDIIILCGQISLVFQYC